MRQLVARSILVLLVLACSALLAAPFAWADDDAPGHDINDSGHSDVLASAI